MNWRHVFDCKKPLVRDFSQQSELAEKSGYRFMAFNGEIYFYAAIWHEPDKKYLVKWVQTPLKVNRNGEIE